MRLKEFCKLVGLSKNGVMKAIDEGRISSFTKDKSGYLFDADRAFQEYMDNTQRNLSSNDIFDDEIDERETTKSGQSVLDVPAKYWNVQEALQAKTIYQALKVKHELDVQQGLYYLKTEADDEILRISQVFARGLISLPVKLKQKHPELDEKIYNDLKELCKDLAKDTESKL